MVRGGVRLLAGVGEGFPVVLSVVATAAGNAPGAHPGRGKPGLRGSRFRWLLVGVGEGFPVVLSVVATAAGNAPGARPGRNFQVTVVEELNDQSENNSKSFSTQLINSLY